MTTSTPNAPSAATVENAVPSLDAIAAKMTAMRDQTQRNLLRESNESAPGPAEEANSASPVAPNEPKITSTNDANIDLVEDTEAPVEPEGLEAAENAAEESEVQVSSDDAPDSTSDELIDFIEFAETNPKAKFKFMRNGKEIVIDAKRAAAILGQGGAIHEEARQLKVERAEFEEFQREQKAQQEGLTLAMELTVAPKLQQAYNEILKTQGYNQVFQEQLARTQDPTEQAKIQANIAQNERYMNQQGEFIRRMRPNVDYFRQVRQQQVAQVIDQSRKTFKDKELRNEYVFNELREKLTKSWENAQGETLPGIKNIDLVTADEHILGLIRDGLKFRDRPQARQAGTSIAALTSRKTSTPAAKSDEDNLNKLREQAKGSGKQAKAAADNLLVAQLQKLRASRGSR
jgi:hypothetical protein